MPFLRSNIDAALLMKRLFIKIMEMDPRLRGDDRSGLGAFLLLSYECACHVPMPKVSAAPAIGTIAPNAVVTATPCVIADKSESTNEAS